MNYLGVIAKILDSGDVPLPRAQVSGTNVNNILQIVFSIAGGIALLVIIVAALRFVVANGDPQSVAKAKNSIIYATLGLIVCLMGFSIVRFVLGRV